MTPPYCARDIRPIPNSMDFVDLYALIHNTNYKLLWSNGDIKSVQGDSGHAQSSMVTEVYSHILDDGRRRNAEVFNSRFYGEAEEPPEEYAEKAEKTSKKGRPKKESAAEKELLEKIRQNPEFADMLRNLLDSK